MNAFERKLYAKINLPDLAQITPGVVVDVQLKGRRKALVHVGKTYDFYDLASLTKVIFTASYAINHFAAHPHELKAPIRAVLPWWRRQTTPQQLLTHTAGLEWWVPLYKKLKGPLEPEARWAQVTKHLAKVRPKRRAKAVYSDIDLWMMGAYLCARANSPLQSLWDQVASDLHLDGLWFHPGNRPKYARSRYAPTEVCPWRKRTLQGEVHDENCWAMGGVAPHAGLFGTIEGVSAWGLELRAAVRGQASGFASGAMARKFTGRRVPRAIGDWGLGFMKPTLGRASCGRYFHSSSFGHTGFVGTSYWYDPKRDLQVVILSNRVHPTRQNARFVSLRPQIHDWICELL